MPRPKKDPPALEYRPGSKALEEVKNYERLMRKSRLERDLRHLLPDTDIDNRKTLLPLLHLFRQENDHLPRANITLTLSLRAIEVLAWLEDELAMKRGKVIDWVLAGFWVQYQQYREEMFKKARREMRSRENPNNPDPDLEDEEDEE